MPDFAKSSASRFITIAYALLWLAHCGCVQSHPKQGHTGSFWHHLSPSSEMVSNWKLFQKCEYSQILPKKVPIWEPFLEIFSLESNEILKTSCTKLNVTLSKKLIMLAPI